MATRTPDGGHVVVIGVLLAACAGAVDVFAFFALGKAFAGIATGNLGVRQLAALLAGATVCGVFLAKLRAAAPAVPVVLLAAVLAVHVLAARSTSAGDMRGGRA